MLEKQLLVRNGIQQALEAVQVQISHLSFLWLIVSHTCSYDRQEKLHTPFPQTKSLGTPGHHWQGAG